MTMKIMVTPEYEDEKDTFTQKLEYILTCIGYTPGPKVTVPP